MTIVRSKAAEELAIRMGAQAQVKAIHIGQSIFRIYRILSSSPTAKGITTRIA